MNFIFVMFPIIFFMYTLFYLYISVSVLIKKKPVILFSRFTLILLSLCFIPIIISSIFTFRYTTIESLIQLIIPVLLLTLLIYYFFFINGLTIYGINEEDFRSNLLQILNEMNISYTEKINKLICTELQTTINVSFNERTGTGSIRIKDKNQISIKEISKNFRIIIKQNNLQTKKTLPYFYLAFALIMAVVTVFYTIFLVKML